VWGNAGLEVGGSIVAVRNRHIYPVARLIHRVKFANMSADDSGETAGRIAYNLPEWMAISGFTAVAWYNIVQLNVSVFLTFKRRRGLYFWSLLISGYGVIFHSVGFLLKLFALTDDEWVPLTLITVGWWPMVTGQSLVLYSRLHLVVKEDKILKGVLTMIIFNAVTLHPPTTILSYGSSSSAWRNFLPGFNVMERIQMTIFCLQEIVISCIYLWASFRLLKPVYRRRIRMVMLQLLWVNFIMAAMDMSMLTMEYLGNYAIEATLKSMIYAVKLTLEFAVLNQLMRLANSGRTNHDMETIAEKGHDHDDEESQRPKGFNRFVPQRMAKLHIAPRNHSVSSPTDEPPRRLSSIARQPSIVDTPSTASALFATRSKNSNTQAGIPRLTINLEEHSSLGSPSTIINNPAAFVPQRPKPRDPFAVEGITPSGTPYEPASPPSTVFQDHPPSYFDTPNSPPARPTKTQQQYVEPKSRALIPAHEEEERNVTPDPELLIPRRPSVMDFTPDNSGGELETDLGANPASPGATDGRLLKRMSGLTDTAGSAPAWLSTFYSEQSRSSSPSNEPGEAPVGSDLDIKGAKHLEFVTSAL
jgi:hypothetical protein